MSDVKKRTPSLKILETDPGLVPFEEDLKLRMRLYEETLARLTGGDRITPAMLEGAEELIAAAEQYKAGLAP